MAYYYFPSCKATAQFKDASKKARAYVKEQFGINPMGCCRSNTSAGIVSRSKLKRSPVTASSAQMQSIWAENRAFIFWNCYFPHRRKTDDIYTG